MLLGEASAHATERVLNPGFPMRNGSLHALAAATEHEGTSLPMAGSEDNRIFGWYLHNALAASADERLTRLVRRHIVNLNRSSASGDEQFGDLDPARGESVRPAGQRPILLRYLARFASRPEAHEDELARNYPFLGAAFALTPLDLDILRLVADARRVYHLDRFGDAVCTALRNPARAIGALIGAPPAAVASRLVRTAPLRACGLVEINPASTSLQGRSNLLDIAPRIWGALHVPHESPAGISAAILGEPCPAALGWDDFAHLGDTAELAASVLRAAANRGERGIHVLLAGPPGTGKTELAKALAAHAGLWLYAAGEEPDEGGDEPSRSERSAALRLTLALLSNRRDCAVLLDEAEDVLDSARSFGAHRDAFSKAFMHRMLETSPVPVIWTCNETGWMDPATLRRMTLVVRVGVPDEAGRIRIWQRILASEGLAVAGDAPTRLAARWTASAGVAAGAARAARLAKGGEAALEAALSGVARAVGAGRPKRTRADAFDPALTACGTDLSSLVERLASPGISRAWSLCLSGPPGTGKTAFAHHLAGRLGMPVLQKRASDLLSMWVGGTEQQIAAAFAEAEEREALLLIDEAESLMFDRTAAVRAFEVSQVDELLSWMEQHPLPLVCTTNLPERMDHAVPRRFTLKLRFEPLDARRARLAFQRILGAEPTAPLPDGLTPGDFAVVRRKAALLGERRPAMLLAWLEEEAAAKGAARAPIGFRPSRDAPARLHLLKPPMVHAGGEPPVSL